MVKVYYDYYYLSMLILGIRIKMKVLKNEGIFNYRDKYFCNIFWLGIDI